MAVSPSPFWLLRRVIDKYIKTAASLEAFIHNFFPRVAREMSSTMERTAQVNLLFSYESAPSIQRALEQEFGDDEATLTALRADLGITTAPVDQPTQPTQLPPSWLPQTRPPQDWTPQATNPSSAASREPPPPLIFIEYADQDLDLLQELTVHLEPLVRAQRLRVFTRAQIAPGADWQAVVAAQLAQAAVILPLISPELLASARFTEFLHELQQLVGCRIVPLLARPVLWEQSPLGGLAPLPASRHYLGSLGRREREHALVEIVRWLLRMVGTRAA